MSQPGPHSDLAERDAPLRGRLREVGLLLVVCNRNGELIDRPPKGEDWLSDLFCEAPMFRSVLRETADRWADESKPAAVEAMPGLWLAPMPVVRRRRRFGYSIAVIPTEAFLTSEHLAAMCQATETDRELTQRRLAQLPPASAVEVDRLAALVRSLLDDERSLATSRGEMESVGQQLAESYEEINLLYTIIQSMKVVERPSRFVALACEELLATLPYAWIGTQLADDPERLKRLADRLIIAGDPPHPAETLRPLARELLADAKADTSMVLEPARKAPHAHFDKLGASAVAHPVSSDGQVIGLLIAGDRQGAETAPSSVDVKLLAATATHMAIFLENAALYDDLNAMFLGTLEALTASIDAKDRYTCGHSQRVALLTQQLAQAVGLDEHTVSRMHIAGLVHDVGKIGVPEAVLLKPGRLTEEEFNWIRKHPSIGYRILKDIPQLKDILPGVLYHHERWDGKGYPQGLSGDQIPRVARLIALADAFDAMSSNRPYRPDLSREHVLEEILKCSGTQFDAELAPIFVRLDFSRYDRLATEHRATSGAAAAQREEEAA